MKRRGSDAIDWRGMPGDDGRIHVELPDPLQVEFFKRMSPAERVAAAFGMARFARRFIRANIRGLYPEWTPDQVDTAVAERFLGHAG